MGGGSRRGIFIVSHDTHLVDNHTADVRRHTTQRAYPLLKRHSQTCLRWSSYYASGVHPRRHSVVPAAPGEARAGMWQVFPLPRVGSVISNRRLGPPGAIGKPISRQTAPQGDALSGWRAHSRGTSGEGKTRNPFFLSYPRGRRRGPLLTARYLSSDIRRSTYYNVQSEKICTTINYYKYAPTSSA